MLEQQIVHLDIRDGAKHGEGARRAREQRPCGTRQTQKKERVKSNNSRTPPVGSDPPSKKHLRALEEESAPPPPAAALQPPGPTLPPVTEAHGDVSWYRLLSVSSPPVARIINPRTLVLFVCQPCRTHDMNENETDTRLGLVAHTPPRTPCRRRAILVGRSGCSLAR